MVRRPQYLRELSNGATAWSAVALIALLAGCGTEREEREQKTATQAKTPTFKLTIAPTDEDAATIVVSVSASNFHWPQVTDDAAKKMYGQALSLHLLPDESHPATIQAAAPVRPSAPSVLGKHSVDANRLRFEPAFPLLAEERYAAYFDPSALPQLANEGLSSLKIEYQVPPRRTAAKPQIAAIYPTSTILPANHLKFYLLFSEPMQQGDIFGFFSLKNLTKNEPVPRPFRHTELWSSDNRRLTLWFHPGRQKTGVNLNIELGPILDEGDDYKLIISGDWPSQRGTPLGKPLEKRFRAGPPDRRQPDPDHWVISNPRAGTRDILRCELREPLDWALLHSQITVEDPSGQPIAGTVDTGYGEMSWNFEPKSAWKPGVYRLAIGTVLEDLAGNSIERPFEVDLTRRSAEPARPLSKPTSPAKQAMRTVYRNFDVVPTGSSDEP